MLLCCAVLCYDMYFRPSSWNETSGLGGESALHSQSRADQAVDMYPFVSSQSKVETSGRLCVCLVEPGDLERDFATACSLSICNSASVSGIPDDYHTADYQITSKIAYIYMYYL